MKAIHQQIEGWLDAEAAQGLSPADQAALSRHLAECPECRKIQQEYQSMSRLLQEDLAARKPSADFEERLVKGFRRAAREEKEAEPSLFERLAEAFLGLGRLPAVQWSGALALLVALVGIGALLTREPMQLPKASDETKAVIADQSQYVETGIPANAKPADGKNFDLNAFKLALDKPSQTLTAPASDATAASRSLFANTIPSYHTGALASYKINDIVNVKGGVVQGVNGDALDSAQAQSATPPKATPQSITYGSLQVQVAGNAVSADKPSGSTTSPGEIHTTINYGQTQVPVTLKLNPAAPVAAPQTTATDDTRKVIRNAHLEFEVAKFDDAVSAIDAAAKAQGGFIDTKNSAQGTNGKVSGTVTVKVLPDHLDAFLAQIGPIGELKNQQIGTEDITKDYYDTDARLRNAQKMEERLLDILDKKTGKVSELLEVEQELGRVRSQIEQMQGEMKAYDALIQYATVTIVLREKDLTQAAAFLIREQAEIGLLSSDVEKAFHDALAAVDTAHGQVLESGLVRQDGGRVHGTIRFQIEPDGAEAIIGELKALGRVAHFSKSDQEVAQGGQAASDTAQVKRDRVAVTVTIDHDEEVRQTVALTVIGPGVEGLFDQAKQAAATAGADVLNSNLQKTEGGTTEARLTVRVPAAAFAALRDAFQGLGRVTGLNVTRNDGLSPTADADRAPVELDLTLADEEAPMQETGLVVATDGVDAKAAALKQAAADLGITVKSSTFERTSESEETAEVVFRMPLSLYADFLARLKALGKVESFTEQRTDRVAGASAPTDTSTAPVEISLRLHREGAAIAEENGVTATVHRTLAQGAAALTWSLRMIGVALAFLLPWLGLGAAAWGTVALVKWGRKQKR